jgi:sugar phosphate isomerase/epimerase
VTFGQLSCGEPCSFVFIFSWTSLQMASLRLFRCLWGTLPITGSHEKLVRPAELLDSVISLGYVGVELTVKDLVENPVLVKEITARGLKMICIAFTDGFNATIPALNCRSGSSVKDHLDVLEKQLDAVAHRGVELVNIHGGRDFFSPAEVHEYFSGFQEMERRYAPLPIAHETHRSRIFYSPWTILPILEKFPTLKLVADFVRIHHLVFLCCLFQEFF